MCELYVKADPILYESRSRSLRIRGVVTTLRLENQFWDILSEIAEVDGMTTNQLIAKLYECRPCAVRLLFRARISAGSPSFP